MWFIVSIVGMDILTACLRIYLASKVSILEIKDIIKQILIPAILVGFFSSISCYFLSTFCHNNLLGLFILLIINSLLLVIIIYLTGLSKSERNLINKLLIKYKK